MISHNQRSKRGNSAHSPGRRALTSGINDNQNRTAGIDNRARRHGCRVAARCLRPAGQGLANRPARPGQCGCAIIQYRAARGLAQERLYRRAKHRIRVPFVRQHRQPTQARGRTGRTKGRCPRGALLTLCACGATGDEGDSNRHHLRRSRGIGSGREPGSARRQHHWHISDGGGVAREMRRADSRHASVGSPGGRYCQ